MRSQLTPNDFVTMNRQIRKMGGVSKLYPAPFPAVERRPQAEGQVDEGALDRTGATSSTP